MNNNEHNKKNEGENNENHILSVKPDYHVNQASDTKKERTKNEQ